MSLEKSVLKLNEKLEKIKKRNTTSLNKLEKFIDFIYVIDVGGSLIRKYQKPLSERLGWTEKTLTIRNAIYCGIIPALFYSVLIKNFGDGFDNSYYNIFYSYPLYMIALNSFRIVYSLKTKRSIGSPSIYNFVGSSIYFLKENLEKIKKPAEGFEPSTY